MPRTRRLLADTETTGAGTEDRACEVAWYELDDNLQIIDEQHSRIDPERPISAGASGVHGITNADVADCPTLSEFFGVVLGGTYFQPDDAVTLIAHNAAFDVRYLAPHMPIKSTICTLRLARRVWPSAENHKLATLMYEMNLKKGDSHSAKGDVLTTYDLLCRIVQETGKTLAELEAESLAPLWVEKMPFGKHRGTSLRVLNSGYVKWLLALDNLDRDMRWSLEQVQKGTTPAA